MVAAAALGAAAVVALPLPAQANWQPWANLGGETLYSGPGFADSRQVFARNAAGNVMMTDPSVAGTIWTQIGDWPMVGAPAVLPGRVTAPWESFPAEVYHRSPDNHVRFVGVLRICRMGCFWNYYGRDLGGAVTSSPAAIYLLPNRVDVFARGADNQLQHTWQYRDSSDPWASWEDLGGTLSDSPSAVSWWDGNRLDVFVRGGDAHLWHKWWISNQGWSGWENLGGVLTSAPSVIRFDDSRLDVFAKSTSDTLIHRCWAASTGWSAWEDLGGRFQYGPAAVKTGDRRIDVYVTGSTAQLEHIWWG